MPIIVKFTDMVSYVGDINRWDTPIVFSLKREGGVLDRYILAIRLCIFPGGRRNMMRNRLELFRIKIELSLKEEEMFGFWQKGEITVELYILWETYCIKMTWSKVDYMEPRNLEGE